MHTQSFSFDPVLSGTAHGFFESTLNDRRTLSHGGDYPPFDTLLALIPEENTGIYVSYNCETDQAGEALLQAFMDHYFPGTPITVPQPPADFASRVRSYTGEYEGIPSDENAGAYWKAFTFPCQVQPGPEGTLLIDRISGQGKDTYIEVQPFVLQNTRTGDLVVFGRDERDQVRYMAVGLIKLVKLPWYGRRIVKLGILGISLLIFLSTVIAALIALFIQRARAGYRQALSPARASGALGCPGAMRVGDRLSRFRARDGNYPSGYHHGPGGVVMVCSCTGTGSGAAGGKRLVEALVGAGWAPALHGDRPGWTGLALVRSLLGIFSHLIKRDTFSAYHRRDGPIRNTSKTTT